MTNWNWITWFWAIWVIGFMIVEAIAVFNNVPGDTLSEHVWRLIGTDQEDRTAMMWIWRAGLLVLLAWLIPHMMTGWRWFNS